MALAGTPCETCDNVHTATRKKSPHYWLCMRFPRLENMNAIAPNTWVNHDPYNRCVNINLGYCPLHTSRRDGQMELTPRDTSRSKPDGVTEQKEQPNGF